MALYVFGYFLKLVTEPQSSPACNQLLGGAGSRPLTNGSPVVRRDDRVLVPFVESNRTPFGGRTSRQELGESATI